MNSSYPDTEGPRHIAEIWSPDALPLRARLDFSPVPQSKRGPGRIRSVSIRFRPDRYVEHKHALAFYKSQLAFHGDGTRALVRALLHYRDTITGSSYASVPSDTPAGWSEPEVRTLSLAFRSIPSAERGDAHRLHYVSARLRVDRWIEHAEAHKFISSQRELYGHGRMQEIVVRALLHWRDALAEG